MKDAILLIVASARDAAASIPKDQREFQRGFCLGRLAAEAVHEKLTDEEVDEAVRAINHFFASAE